MRALFVFTVLFTIKILSRLFYRFDSGWVGVPLEDPWENIRLAALLHHTSLFEPVFLGVVPNRLLWRIARKGVVPGADKTLKRPLVGLLFKVFARRVIPITRQRDHTWDDFMGAIGSDALVIMAPEGRMMRPSGLDLAGKPMSVRGGIADTLEAIEKGRMLIVYSGGLHHVQAPGEKIPRLFQTVRLRLEALEIDAYCSGFPDPKEQPDAFKTAVIRDLEVRRTRFCPV